MIQGITHIDWDDITEAVPAFSYAELTLADDGIYRIVIKNSKGVVLNTLEGMQYSSEIDFGGMYVDILGSYGSNTTAINNANAELKFQQTAINSSIKLIAHLIK